jgi:acetyl esterase/lipase
MSTEVVNPILPEFITKLDPQFVEIYNKYQGRFSCAIGNNNRVLIDIEAPRLQAHQVTIEEYRSDPSKYTFQITPGPYPDVGKTEVINIKVEQPEGEIKLKVYTPTDDAVQKGGLKTAAGLPAHVNYHGGACLEIFLRTVALFADRP